jgi:uncharacterized protein (DUF2147 family)
MQSEYYHMLDRVLIGLFTSFRKFVYSALLSSALFLAAAISPVASKADQESSPVGLWQTEDAQVEIYEADGKLNGKIAALDKKWTTDGIEKTDISNPDPAKKKRPLVGLIVMIGFTPDGSGRWDHGTVYDPKSGNTYASFLEYSGGDTLKLRGYIGISFIGRTAVWTKVKE